MCRQGRSYEVDGRDAAGAGGMRGARQGGTLPARVIPPDEVGQETRGKGSNTRYVRNILPEFEPARGEPAGGRGDHARRQLVELSAAQARPRRPAGRKLLEETYYHRLSPPQGYGVQRVYTDDRSLDETMAFGDRDVVLVPKGYHPVGAAHGYDLYYLNVMAGPKRIWKFHNDPDARVADEGPEAHLPPKFVSSEPVPPPAGPALGFAPSASPQGGLDKYRSSSIVYRILFQWRRT